MRPFSDPAASLSATERPRAALEDTLAAAASGRGPIQIVSAPRGAGKSTLLRRVAGRLEAAGTIPVLLPMDRLCTSAAAVARHLPAAVIGRARAVTGSSSLPRGEVSLGILGAIEEEASRRKPDPGRLLDLAVSFPRALASEADRPLTLLLDEIGEAAALSRHAGLRRWPEILASRLVAGTDVALIATVSPASRASGLLGLIGDHASLAGRQVESHCLQPLTEAEVETLLQQWGCPPGRRGMEIGGWMQATGGHAGYVEILARRVSAGGDLATALTVEITPPYGALHQECRFDYHHLVERSRGHAAVRNILHILSTAGGCNLSSIARRLGISLPTALDYLSWLAEVGLIRRAGRVYHFADPVLRLWTVLNGPDPKDIAAEVAAFLGEIRTPSSTFSGEKPAASTPIRPPAPLPAPPAPVRPADPSDRLMEID